MIGNFLFFNLNEFENKNLTILSFKKEDCMVMEALLLLIYSTQH
jgi:hypothetical protein